MPEPYDHPITIICSVEIEELNNLHSVNVGMMKSISLGRELSSYLITADGTDRSSAAQEWLLKIVRESASGPVLLTDIDLLFHPSIKIDPVVLFQRISRITRIIILWPGEYKDDVLSYSQPEHHHYRFWKNPEGIEIKGVHDALQ